MKWGCLYNWRDWNSISLNFEWKNNNSTLNIVWDGWSPIIDNIYFQLWTPNSWNITFENFNFSRNDVIWFYFEPIISWNYSLNSMWIKIKKSFINISEQMQLSKRQDTCLYWWWHWPNYNCWSYAYIRNGWISIENSRIDVKVNNNYNFYMPYLFKNNKINIIIGT